MSRGTETAHKQLNVLRCKLVIVGDATVGKTALAQVFQSGGSTYPKNYMMTIGADYSVKQLPIPDTNAIVELHMYDCAGQSIFNQVEMNSKYYDNVAAVAVVYDIGNRESLLSCRKWFTSIKTASTSGNNRLFGVLIGNKCEYRTEGVATGDSRADVLYEDGARVAEELGLAYFETSCATNLNVEEPFMHIAKEFHRQYGHAVNQSEEMIASEY